MQCVIVELLIENYGGGLCGVRGVVGIPELVFMFYTGLQIF